MTARRKIHRAHLIGKNGEVSALCFRMPRAIPGRDTWSTDDNAVNCRACRALLQVRSEALRTHADAIAELRRKAGDRG